MSQSSDRSEAGGAGPGESLGDRFGQLLNDGEWTRGRGPIGVQIGLATFGILALELALIRWTSSQIRVFAYFNNLVLIGAFLGMGLGLALGKRRAGLVHLALPALAVLSVPLAFSESLNLVRLSFPDAAVSLWGAEKFIGAGQYALHLAIFIGLFLMVVTVFVFTGAAVGWLFPQREPLRAYTADLLGSLIGIVAFTGATFLHAGPPVWLAIGGLPFLWLSRRWRDFLALAVVVALGAYSVMGAVFSAYNRIDLGTNEDGLILKVNRDFHQIMHDLSDRALTDPKLSDKLKMKKRFTRSTYDIPFVVGAEKGRALVVGAGTGNDVEAALRNGFGEVVSVDIDGVILELGRELHPERPYDDPRAKRVVNDARAFFEQYDGPPFDVVCYGLVDSHAMFSSMSTLRLDNYLYTDEGIRSAWKLVSDRGVLALSFSVFAGDWIADRLYWLIHQATGKAPIVLFHGMNFGATFLVAKDDSVLHLEGVGDHERYTNRAPLDRVRTPTDDWPFLYVRPGVFPWGYVLMISAVLIIAVVATPLAFGRAAVGRDFDPVLFLCGAAFLLIETRGVTSLSLLFGSTWIVNAAVFSGVLVMALLANLAVLKLKIQNPLPWFILLLASVIFLWAFKIGTLNQLPMLARGLAGGLIHALPIGFAGVVVSIFLARSQNSSASLGSNLLGAVVGGAAEYLSMFVGLRALVLVAFVVYLAACLFYLLRRRAG